MPGPCPAVAPQGEFLRQMLASVDCHAQSIGAGGWAALASPSSPVSLVLAGVLTILSGRERTVRLLDEIRAQTGDDPAEWIPRLLEVA